MLPLIPWALCWILGGMWLVRAAFKLHPEEEGFIGLVVGLAAEVGLVNFLARVLPLQWASWISALIVLLVGFILAFTHGGLPALKVKTPPGQWIAFLVITYIAFLLSRGLALYDDYAHLPTLSLMAAGAIPPHFALNPQIAYGYHYFVLLFGAQIMRLSGSMPWTAWDIARSFTLAPAVFLAALWAVRVAKNKLADIVGGLGVLFISGTRWLLLLIPDSLLSRLSSQLQLIGAGAAAGPTLVTSLPNPWPVDGQGTFPFPYAFLNGIFSPGIELLHSVFGLMLVAVFFTLLLTASRWKNPWIAGFASIILISSLGLLTELELLLIASAFILLTIYWIIRHRTFKLPPSLKMWLGVWLISALIIAVQGGAWTDILNSLIARLQGLPTPQSYQVTGLVLAAPSIVSNQLGIMSLTDLRSIFIASLEIGPILLVLPLLIIWGWKAARAERWFDAALMLAAFLSLGMIFVHFSGSVRNTSRLYIFVPVSVLMAVPLTWNWASHRKQIVKRAAGFLGGVVMLGGIVLLGAQMPNIKNHQYSFFISPYDAKMTEMYWDKLDPGALVFDSYPNRAVTIFGRYTNAGNSWAEYSAQFDELVALPDVMNLRKAGYSYAYITQQYWDGLTPTQQQVFTQPCISLVQQIYDPNNGEGWRKLYDIKACQ